MYKRQYQYRMYEISDMLGFDTPYYFSSVVKKITGYTPKEYEDVYKRQLPYTIKLENRSRAANASEVPVVWDTVDVYKRKEDVFVNGVPSLGFYGQFLPMVPDYSCAESPFWIANPFVALTYPEEHPFWSAVEENGCWERLGRQEAEPYLPCSARGYEETVRCV